MNIIESAKELNLSFAKKLINKRENQNKIAAFIHPSYIHQNSLVLIMWTINKMHIRVIDISGIAGPLIKLIGNKYKKYKEILCKLRFIKFLVK